MSSVEKRILERAAKLKALSTSDNENEAANAVAALQRLMDQHRFAMADVESMSCEPGEGAQAPDDDPVFGRKRPPVWMVDLLVVLAEANGCVEFDGLDEETGKRRLFFVAGRPEDVQFVRMVWSRTCAVLRRLGARHFRHLQLSNAAKGDWYLGAVHGIEEQLRRVSEESRRTASPGALSVIDQRKTDAEMAVERLAGEVRRRPDRARRGDRSAYDHGFGTGTNVELVGRRSLGDRRPRPR
jgi:hypothetical protein